MGSKSEHNIFLKLEPIKEKLSFSTSLVLSTGVCNTSDAEGQCLTDFWVLTSGNSSFSTLTNGVLIQFCEYNPETKIEKEIFHLPFQVGGSNQINFTTTYADEDYSRVKEIQKYFEILDGKLKFKELPAGVTGGATFRKDVEPYINIYVLPANYVTKQVRLSNIQAYWQDPIHPHAMWLQLEDWVTTGTGPYSVTVAAGPPATLTQTALVSDAATGSELYHNIIPYLDTIMTYEN